MHSPGCLCPLDGVFVASAGLGSRGFLGGVQVSFAADAMLAAVFRVALKAFGERARFLTLPGPGFRQVQLDADFIRQVKVLLSLGGQLRSSSSHALGVHLQAF